MEHIGLSTEGVVSNPFRENRTDDEVRTDLFELIESLSCVSADKSSIEDKIIELILENMEVDYSVPVNGKSLLLAAAGNKSLSAITMLADEHTKNDASAKDKNGNNFLHNFFVNAPDIEPDVEARLSKTSPFNQQNIADVDKALCTLIDSGMPLLKANNRGEIPFVLLLDKRFARFPQARKLALEKVVDQLKVNGEQLSDLMHCEEPIFSYLAKNHDYFLADAFASLMSADSHLDLLSSSIIDAFEFIPAEKTDEYQYLLVMHRLEESRRKCRLEGEKAFRAGKFSKDSYHSVGADIRNSSIAQEHLFRQVEAIKHPDTIEQHSSQQEPHSAYGGIRKCSIVELPQESWNDDDKTKANDYIQKKARQLSEFLQKRKYKWFHIPIKEDARGLIQHQQAMAKSVPEYAKVDGKERSVFTPVLSSNESSSIRKPKQKVFDELPLDNMAHDSKDSKKAERSTGDKVLTSHSMKKSSTAEFRNDFKRRQSLKRGLVTQMRAEAESICTSGTSSSFRLELERRRASSLNQGMIAAFSPGSSASASVFLNDEDLPLESPKSPLTDGKVKWELRRSSSVRDRARSLERMPILMRDEFFNDDTTALLPTITEGEPEPEPKISDVQVNHIAEAIALSTIIPLGVAGASDDVLKGVLLPALDSKEVEEYEKLETQELEQLKEIKQLVKEVNKQAVKVKAQTDQSSSTNVGATLDRLSDVNDALDPLMDDAPTALKIAVDTAELIKQLKDLHSVVREINAMSSNSKSIESIVTSGLSLAETSLGALDVTAQLFAELPLEEAAVKLVERTGAGVGVLSEITGAFNELYQLFKEIKDSDLTGAETTTETRNADKAKEYLQEGVKYGVRVAKIAKQIAKAANTIIELSGGDAVAGLVPGLGIAVHSLAIADQLMHVSKDIQNFSKLAEIKVRLKDQFIGDGELESIIDRETYETDVSEAERIAYNSEDDSSISQDAKDEAKRYLAVRYLKNICEKRLQRAGLKTFIEFARLASAISSATVVGADVGVGIKVTAEAVNLGAYVVREAKQQTHNFLDDGKSTIHKAEERVQHIKTLVGMIEMINDENPAELIRDQLNEIKVMFKSAGLNLAAFTDSKVSIEKRITKLNAALRQRAY